MAVFLDSEINGKLKINKKWIEKKLRFKKSIKA